LAAKAEQAVATISHGERQRLEIAMLLARGSRILLLDEPTAGMTTLETRAICDLVTELREKHGRTVLLIEHDMGFVRALECPIVVMVRGKVIA
ncbi:ATP-binding cassette domain-containing protein, partial [Streptococcus pneumoniae]|nr:ATP-binding cassette domain-containing protein [Streptococcus pneumoniae]